VAGLTALCFVYSRGISAAPDSLRRTLAVDQASEPGRYDPEITSRFRLRRMGLIMFEKLAERRRDGIPRISLSARAASMPKLLIRHTSMQVASVLLIDKADSKKIAVSSRSAAARNSSSRVHFPGRKSTETKFVS